VTRKTLIAGVMVIFACGCSGDADYTPIDFSRTVETEAPELAEEGSITLRVAVAAMVSPKETFVIYKKLLDYISRHMGFNVTLVQRRTYSEINELFPKKEIDLAFICTGPYAVGKQIFGFDALATPVIRGQPLYQSYLIVHKDSGLNSLPDLNGKVFAFTDPESNTGAMVPKYWLTELNATPDSFFSELNYTYSHDNSILAVAKGLVDGAAVDGHIWEYYNQKNPLHTSVTRVIKKSEPFGSPPVVASRDLPDPLKNQIRMILLTMHEEHEGRQILEELLIDRFVVPEDEWYNPVREVYQRVGSVVMNHETHKF
jgi:phosphonate transport system substrate-binding protein